ncbi:MAG: hypothetical protein OHK0053_31440 [Microscillaceae bacterium]
MSSILPKNKNCTMEKKTEPSNPISEALRQVEQKMQTAKTPEEHAQLEKEMAELMQKLLLQLRHKK